jgi:NitT/TauT family transport system substrate-binding protein
MKRLSLTILAALLVLALLAGCQTTPAPASSEPELPDPQPKATVRLMGMSGPTTMGMVKLLAENDKDNTENHYEFQLVAEAASVTAAIAKGEVDIAAIPANLSSVVYNNTDGSIRLIAVNTLGVLYIVETGDSIQSVADLAGKTVYATGKGTTPEMTLNYLLKNSGLDPATDLTVEYKTEAGEVAAILAQGDAIAMLPQPFVTVAQNQNDKIRIALDITAEWEKVVEDSSVVTGVAVVRTEFLEENPEAVDKFLSEYQASINYVNANVAEAAQMVGELGIVPAPVAEKAIPLCNLAYLDGEEMQQKVGGFLAALYEQDPASVGGKLPDEAFYYKK